MFDSDRPIYLQIMEIIQRKIAIGEYISGEKMPSVRDLALEFAVNPNTIQKALVELERTEIIHTMRTTGRFISNNLEKIKNMQDNLGIDEVARFLEKMGKLGFNKEKILELIREN